MKQQKRTKLFKRLLLLVLLVILPQVVNAYDFMANGIAYNIVSSANKTLEVTYKTSSSPGSDGSTNYSGNIVISETVYYSGANYTVIGIGEQAFKNSFISSLKLPETLTYIKQEAFTTCFSLSELSIPASVTEIGASCFWVCPDLKKVYSYASTPPTCTGTNVFTYMQYNNATLYVPYGCLSLYKNAYGWKDFPNFMEMAPMIDGHEYVDLQLPSGKLWATKNYGASSVSDYGTYVEWSSNDVINSSWGSNWKTPSINDIKELINNCSWIWGSVDGKLGYTVKGTNGNSIFLPAAGVKMGSVMKIGEWCYYWSSTPQSSDMVYILLSTASDVWYGSLNTMANLPIRPVADNPSPVIPATGITLNKSELSLELGNSEILVATVTPNNVTNGSVTWSSSNTSVVSVSPNGMVTAHAVGSAVITASTTDGTNLRAICNVTVIDTKITGDVNNDGEVTIADVNAVINVILGGSSSQRADVNNDGEITIADVNSIIDIILGSHSQQENHDYVNLGLPSGTLWATMNVGACSPEDYGDYFAWGETTSKQVYEFETYKWYNNTYYTYTKYCISSSYGTVDNKTELDPEDDAATLNWGPSWRMPTQEQIQELINNCSRQWKSLNGVGGIVVTGPNGNTLFLPAAGYRLNGSVYNAGTYGYVWSRTLSASKTYNACSLIFNPGELYLEDFVRIAGFTVRAVRVSQN
jgi:uncharacterized protein YjdB